MKLGRTITPYIGQTVILAGVTIFLAYVGQKTSDWKLLWLPSAIIWPLFTVSTLYFGLKYMVLWDDAGVVMRASGVPERRISI